MEKQSSHDDLNGKHVNLHERKYTEEIEKLNQKLLDSENLKSNFLSNIRNEISNPLTSILGLSKSLHTSNDLTNNKILAGLIYAEVLNLSFQMQNIFAAAEIESGEQFPHYSRVDIRSLIGNVVDALQYYSNKKEIEITVNSDKRGILYFTTDAEKLSLTLTNIIKNALEFSYSKGFVQISYNITENGSLVILVEDEGVGINNEKISEIFDRFKQLETGTTKTFSGHGLGLAVVKASIESLNGQIEVESVEDKGSKFIITVPEGEISGSDEISTSGNEFLFEESELF